MSIIKPKAIERNVSDYLSKMKEGLWEDVPPHFITSSLHKSGVEEVLSYIDHCNKVFHKTA